MPFGIMNASSTFQRMMDHFLADVDFARVYLEDALVFSTNLEENFEQVSAAISSVEKHTLKLKLAKCHLAEERIGVLGHIVDEHGVRVDSGKFESIQAIPSQRYAGQQFPRSGMIL